MESTDEMMQLDKEKIVAPINTVEVTAESNSKSTLQCQWPCGHIIFVKHNEMTLVMTFICNFYIQTVHYVDRHCSYTPKRDIGLTVTGTIFFSPIAQVGYLCHRRL